MLPLRFRLTDKVGVTGLERNENGVSGWAGIKEESGGALERFSIHFSIEASDVCAVMTDAVDILWEKWCRSLMTPSRLSDMIRASSVVP